MVERIKVSFTSAGVRCAGYLHLPGDGPGRVPCLVLCQGFSGTMDRLFPYAERFAAAGFAALVFDYRNFGESDGEPRQLVDVDGQQDDIRAAVAFARGHERVDPGRIALWGSSLGGAHVVSVAAGDAGVAAVIAQVPFAGTPRKVEGRSAGQVLRLQAAVLWDAARGRLGLRPYYIPMLGGPGELAVVVGEEARRYRETLAGETTLWRNRAAPRALLRMARYRPGDAAERLRAPLLVCIGSEDRETPRELTQALADRAPRGELRAYPGSHYVFYTDPETRARAIADEIAFLRRHLVPATATGRDGTGGSPPDARTR